ncbi:MAG TPA: peptidyl-alpha-hydroxyglycine alpha-amidating lyase family protein [Vicinamibacterales bacterium]|nr:peptidyl-alpha-hydroxyglycine alpha-amidating lyase family protein [Vicinamibacterales bacterium]
MKRLLQLVTLAFVVLGGPAWAQLSFPELAYDAVDPIKLPDNLYLGEAVGVATNSKGNIYVYTRTGNPAATLGTRRTFSRSASRLFEFDPGGKFVREIGQDLYGFVFAHAVRVDRQDNIWVVDEGSNMVIKFDPAGRVLMTMGRKPEALPVPPPVPAPPPAAPAGGRGGGAAQAAPAPVGVGVPGDNFNRPTDVAWDATGNIYVADGYGNSRIAKFDKNGKYLKSWGSRGTAPGQFNIPHTMAIDAQGNVYVGDRGNNRIQVFDGEGTFKTQYLNVGAPSAICITPGPQQYLFASNSNPSTSMDNGEIYKMTLDGRIVGKFGTAGKLLKEFGSVHEMDCRSENDLYVGEITNWRVQKLTLKK